MPSTPSVAQPQAASRGWIWMLVLASLLIVLGALAMGSSLVSAMTLVSVLGWLLIIGGVLQICGALLFRRGGLAADLLFGALIAVLGAVLIWLPVAAGSVIALLLVLGFIADAVFEGVYALIRRPPGWIWLVLLALLSTVLGVFIIANPSLLLLLIELLVGISLVVRGVLLLLLALEARALSR